jgi:hypothetical protein
MLMRLLRRSSSVQFSFAPNSDFTFSDLRLTNHYMKTLSTQRLKQYRVSLATCLLLV